MREYFDEDIARISVEYEAFVRAIVKRGNGEKIWRGESPIAVPVPSTVPSPVPSTAPATVPVPAIVPDAAPAR